MAKVLPMMVKEEVKNPDVAVGKCCHNPSGLLVYIEGEWWLLRDAPNPENPRALETNAFHVAVCRGCYQELNEETPTEPWVYGQDGQLEEHLRQLSREIKARRAAETSE